MNGSKWVLQQRLVRFTFLCVVGVEMENGVIVDSELNNPFTHDSPVRIIFIALLGIKAYVEIYEGRINKVKVDYSTFPQCTHATLLLLILSSLAYHIALWPHYHYNTFLVLGIAFFGVVLQFVLLTPSSIQNVVSFILLAFFLQEYQ
jgi:hypothetical protein